MNSVQKELHQFLGMGRSGMCYQFAYRCAINGLSPGGRLFPGFLSLRALWELS